MDSRLRPSFSESQAGPTQLSSHLAPALPTFLQTDASRLNAVGYALLQDHGSGLLRLIQCGSHFLVNAKTRYAIMELEMLSIG